MNREKLFQAVLDFYRHYAERNDTFESFIYDVNTLGGTFLDGFIETNRSCSIVTDRCRCKVIRLPLKDIYELLRGDQLSLF